MRRMRVPGYHLPITKVNVVPIIDVSLVLVIILLVTAPLMSVLIAVTLLDEPWKPELFAGTLLVVAGGAVLTRERVPMRRMGCSDGCRVDLLRQQHVV